MPSKEIRPFAFVACHQLCPLFGQPRQQTNHLDALRGLLGERRFGSDVESAIDLTVLHRLPVSGWIAERDGSHQRPR
jgi:hypothetical protein